MHVLVLNAIRINVYRLQPMLHTTVIAIVLFAVRSLCRCAGGDIVLRCCLAYAVAVSMLLWRLKHSTCCDVRDAIVSRCNLRSYFARVLLRLCAHFVQCLALVPSCPILRRLVQLSLTCRVPEAVGEFGLPPQIRFRQFLLH